MFHHKFLSDCTYCLHQRALLKLVFPKHHQYWQYNVETTLQKCGMVLREHQWPLIYDWTEFKLLRLCASRCRKQVCSSLVSCREGGGMINLVQRATCSLPVSNPALWCSGLIPNQTPPKVTNTTQKPFMNDCSEIGKQTEGHTLMQHWQRALVADWLVNVLALPQAAVVGIKRPQCFLRADTRIKINK